jgi:hypothetical protein
MNDTIHNGIRIRVATAMVLALVLAVASGCRSNRTDPQITIDIQNKISGENALAGQNIQVSVAKGVATLNGAVSDEASRALAANDAGTVAGVKTVINNLTVQTAQQAPPPAAQPQQVSQPAPAPVEKRRAHDQREAKNKRAHDHPDDQAAAPAPPPQEVASVAPAQPVEAPPPPPPAPPAPPKPVIKEVTLPAGTILPIRITETLDTKTAQTNDAFHGSLAGDIGIQGVIAVPRGTPVTGRIVEAREAAHFKGSASLSLELTELNARGRPVSLVTETYSKQAEGRGANTVEKAGGGAALGAIIGALAGGGKGAAIGGLAGGAAGTGVNAATRGQQVVIPTETRIDFRLQSPVTLTVTIPPPGDDQSSEPKDPALQRR